MTLETGVRTSYANSWIYTRNPGPTLVLHPNLTAQFGHPPSLLTNTLHPVIYCNKNTGKNTMNYAFKPETTATNYEEFLGASRNGGRTKNTNYTVVLFQFNCWCSLRRTQEEETG